MSFTRVSHESRHSREGGNPQAPRWIPAFAGMTEVAGMKVLGLTDYLDL